MLSSVLLWFFRVAEPVLHINSANLGGKKATWVLMGVVFHIPNVFSKLLINKAFSISPAEPVVSKALLSEECSEGLCS